MVGGERTGVNEDPGDGVYRSQKSPAPSSDCVSGRGDQGRAATRSLLREFVVNIRRGQGVCKRIRRSSSNMAHQLPTKAAPCHLEIRCMSSHQ